MLYRPLDLDHEIAAMEVFVKLAESYLFKKPGYHSKNRNRTVVCLTNSINILEKEE